MLLTYTSKVASSIVLAATSVSAWANDTSVCKAVPGTVGWPSSQTWQSLNTSVNGQLLTVPPPAGVCHPGQPNYNPAECPELQAAWLTYAFHSANPVSNAFQNWNNDTCLPNATDPCSSLGYPRYVVNATSPQDVKAGVDFAREHNIRLIVKASGHDLRGRSVAPNSLSIWTASMKGITVHNETFTPQGCNYSLPYPALTALAGSTAGDVDLAAAATNHCAVIGGATTINMGGYTTGGGHGLLGAQLGLAADNVLEMEMVTPQGEIITANECQNQDLFWAMRGGGGSTFGVMTSMTIRMHPDFPLMGIIVGIGNYNVTDPSIWPALAYVLSQLPDMADKGLAGYSNLLYDGPSPIPGDTRNISGFDGQFLLANSTNPQDVLALWEPVIQHVMTTWPGWITLNFTTPWASFSDWYAANNDSTTTGTDALLGSRLLSRESLTTNLTAVAEAIADFTFLGYSQMNLVSGPGVHDAQPRGGNNSVNPGWRSSYVEGVSVVPITPLNQTSKQEAIEIVRATTAKITALSPDTGTYLNEASPYVLDWQEAFWGSNYPRLLSIKQQVDPTEVFWCDACVGSEGWQMDGDQLCKVGY